MVHIDQYRTNRELHKHSIRMLWEAKVRACIYLYIYRSISITI